MVKIRVGTEIGRCKNCSCSVVARQPWLSKLNTVNDGRLLFHCSNEECHNYYGIELNIETENYARLIAEQILDFAILYPGVLESINGGMKMKDPFEELISAISEFKGVLVKEQISDSQVRVIDLSEYRKYRSQRRK